MKRNKGLDRAAAVSKLLDCMRLDVVTRRALAPEIEKILVKGFKLKDRCAVCGRQLHVFESQRRGIGPKCWADHC